MSTHQSLTTDDIRFLYNALRKASVTWSGRKEALKNARKKVFIRKAKNGRPVTKFTWQCATCSKWFWNEKELQVDHVREIGGVGEFNGDWNETIRRMFPRPISEHLQVLCVPCHKRKTAVFLAAPMRYQRKVKVEA